MLFFKMQIENKYMCHKQIVKYINTQHTKPLKNEKKIIQ